MRKLGIIMLACAAALSCAPPFDKDLSLSAVILDSLTLEATVGPVGGEVWDKENIDAMFLPTKSGINVVDADRGFVAYSRGETETGLWFVWQQDGAWRTIGNGGGWDIPNNSPYPRNQLTTIKNGDYSALIRFAATPNPMGDDFVALLAPDFTPLDQANWSIQLVANSPIGAITGYSSPDDRCLGMNIYPNGTDTSENVYWLVWNQSAGGFWERLSRIQGPPPITPATATVNTSPHDLSGFLPAGTARCLYYRGDSDETHFAYVSVSKETNVWETWQFNNSSKVQLTGITKRIDALLTTGELFSTQDKIGRVYGTDGVGAEITHFPLGNLKLCFEAYNGPTPTVYFSQMLIWDRQIHFKVYSIPTSELKSLH